MNVSDFLLENVKPADETREVQLERFASPFVVKGITEKENSALQKSHTKVYRNRSGNKMSDLDTTGYTDSLMVKCVQEPDLMNADLQASYKTEGDASETLKAMLTAGEYAKLSEAVLEVNGFDEEDELVEEVKK